MMTRMIGASSELVDAGEDGSLIPPAELEEFSKQVMEACRAGVSAPSTHSQSGY